MSNFMTNFRKRFFKYFEIYVQRWILLVQQKVVFEQIRKRNFECQTIEIRMLIDEKKNNDKYFQNDFDMFEWNQTDYLIWIFLKVRTANLRSKFDIFYEKRLSDMKINNKIWKLLKLVELRMSLVKLAKKLVKRFFFKFFFDRNSFDSSCI